MVLILFCLLISVVQKILSVHINPSPSDFHMAPNPPRLLNRSVLVTLMGSLHCSGAINFQAVLNTLSAPWGR